MNRLRHDPSNDLNFVIVSHGLTSRVFLMKWFKWTVEQFEHLIKQFWQLRVPRNAAGK
ncbi:hypothetical protein JHK87_028208 [Glycine soja]|nr:hypothetical protein JHK87_028208 [Glycine soja]